MFHDVFEVLNGLHLAVVDFDDDESLGQSGFLELTVADGGDEETGRKVEFFFFFVSQRTQGGSHGFRVEVFECCGCSLCVSQREGDGVFLLVAEIGHFHFVSGAVVHDGLLEFAEFLDFLSVDGGDDVPFAESGFLGSTVGGDFGDVDAIDCAVVRCASLFFFGVNLVSHFGSSDADEGTLHGAVGFEVFNHLVHDGSWDGKTIAAVGAGLGHNHCVDSDQFAFCIDQCSSRVSGVDGSVRLDETFDASRLGTEGARFGADDAGGDGGGEAEGITDGEHPFSKFQFVRTSDGDGGEVFGFDFDECEVGGGVGADDACFVLLVVVEFHGEFVCVFNDVVVGDDVAVSGENDAGACAGAFGCFDFSFPSASSASEEVSESEEVFEWVTIGHGLRAAVGHGFDIDHRIHGTLGSHGQVNVSCHGNGGCRCRESGRCQSENESGKNQQSSFHGEKFYVLRLF